MVFWLFFLGFQEIRTGREHSASLSPDQSLLFSQDVKRQIYVVLHRSPQTYPVIKVKEGSFQGPMNRHTIEKRHNDSAEIQLSL